MEALLLKRAELDNAAPLAEPDFHVVLRGGAWCFAHSGKEYDSTRGRLQTPLQSNGVSR